MAINGKAHWMYKNKYNAQIKQLYCDNGWGALRIYNELRKGKRKINLSMSTVQRRLRELRLKEGI